MTSSKLYLPAHPPEHDDALVSSRAFPISAEDLLLAMPMPVALAEEDRRITASNRAWRTSFGSPSAEGSVQLPGLFPRERERLLAEWTIAAAAQRSYATTVRLQTGPSQEHRRHHLHCRRHGTDASIWWILVAHDVDELLEDVDYYRTLAGQLDTVAAVAAHDLRAPLRAVEGFLTLLQRRQARDVPTSAREYVDLAVEGAQRMRGLIEHVLATARCGRPEDHLQEVSLPHLLAQVLRDLQPEIDAQQATILLQDLPGITAYPSACAQIYQNLISNALRYRSTQPPHITCSACRIDHAWELSVQDNGVGMTQEHCQRLFERSQPSDSRDGGLGIGLATCRRLIEAQGNRLWVTSTVGVGSTFTWTWQDTKGRAIAPTPAAASSSTVSDTRGGQVR